MSSWSSAVVEGVSDTDRPGPRVAQIITTLSRGGAQATVVASADMTELGVDVTVLAGPSRNEEGSFWGDPSIADATVIEVPNLVRRFAPIHDLRTLRWLVRWLRSNRPDVVHTHSSKAGVLGRIAAALVEIPCVHTVHGWGPLYADNRLAAGAAGLVERLLAGITMALVVVGESDLHRGLATGIGRPGSYRVIRSGVDVGQSAAAEADRTRIRAELGLDDRFVVGMVARLSEPKDHDTLVAAFDRAAIHGSLLVLIGDGPRREALERLVADAGLCDRVRFLGARPDAARLVAAFDVAVLSSRWEGMPRSVVEASAASVPVISTEVGGVAELIHDGISGRLVPVGDVDAMAEALLDANQRPAAYQDMAEVASRRSAEFSVDRMRRALANLWFESAGLRSPETGLESDPVVARRSPRAERDGHGDGDCGGERNGREQVGGRRAGRRRILAER